MPIYEYQCDACGHELEALQALSESPLTDCPDCREPRLRKRVSAAAFRLKGGGWYETDFKKDNKRNLAGEASGGGKSSGDGGSGSSGGSGDKAPGGSAGDAKTSKASATN